MKWQEKLFATLVVGVRLAIVTFADSMDLQQSSFGFEVLAEMGLWLAMSMLFSVFGGLVVVRASVTVPAFSSHRVTHDVVPEQRAVAG